MDRCLAPDCELSGVGCDNMTIVLVCLLQGQSKEAYIERLKRESLAGDDSALQAMLQGLKFDQNFANNASPFGAPGSDNSIEAVLNRVISGRDPMHTEEPKPSDQLFITPNESPPHVDECKLES